MTPFQANLLSILVGFAWVTLSALVFWVAGNPWALFLVIPAFAPWYNVYFALYGRIKP